MPKSKIGGTNQIPELFAWQNKESSTVEDIGGVLWLLASYGGQVSLKELLAYLWRVTYPKSRQIHLADPEWLSSKFMPQ